MTKIFSISLKLKNEIFRVGQLAFDEKPKNHSSPALGFRYDADWLKNGFPLGSDLPLNNAVHFPKNEEGDFGENENPPLFGFLRDHQPGKWLENLSRTDENTDQSSSFPFLLHQLSSCRNGKNRFSSLLIGDDFIETADCPILTKRFASELIHATESFFRDPARLAEKERDLLRKTGSDLGGSKMKFLVRSEKLPFKEYVLRVRNPISKFDEPSWMYICAELAKNAGIHVLSGTFMSGVGYLEERFDRRDEEELFCLSAKTLVRLSKNTVPCWLDVADILNREGASPKADLRELFLRLLFDTLTCNARLTLDRIWFFRENGGWKLAPMSSPLSHPPLYPIRTLALPIAENIPYADPQKALALARYFNLSGKEAKEMLLETMRAVGDWDRLARSVCVNPREIALMKNAFHLSS